MLSLVRQLFPRLDSLPPTTRISSVGNVLATLYAAPLGLVGLLWLIRVTDLQVIHRERELVVLTTMLLFIFSRLGFFIIAEIKTGLYADFGGSFEPILLFSAVFLLGPTAAWIPLLLMPVALIRDIQLTHTVAQRWTLARNIMMELTQNTLCILLAFYLYEEAGGVYPLPGLSNSEIIRAFYPVVIWLGLGALLYMPLVFYWNASLAREVGSMGGFGYFMFLIVMWPSLVVPFGILAAGIHSYYGLNGFLFLNIGFVMASLLANQLSNAVENSRRRSIELEKLEKLGQALLNAPPDMASLQNTLRQHISGMFIHARIEIRLFPDQLLAAHPDEGIDDLYDCQAWLQKNKGIHAFSHKDRYPWNQKQSLDAMVIVPILDSDHPDEVIGYIAVNIPAILARRDPASQRAIIPAVQSLAAHVSSALQRARDYNRALAHQRMAQELALAGRIQFSFLPKSLPEVKGWQIAATLEPARQTSGDFYDLIPLPDGRLGIVVADVADKGMGAALFMALSRTLLRTFASEYMTWPEIALQAVNRRIIADTNAGLFVTVFYGVLDPSTGIFTYCNAGHNPAFIVRRRGSKQLPLQPLGRTGVPLGLFEEFTWNAVSVDIGVGDCLVMYTDGVTEARNRNGDFFGDKRLKETLIANRWKSAKAVHQGITRSVYKFIAGAPLYDDLTLLVAQRYG